MPKPKANRSNRLTKFANEHPADFTTDGKVLFCKMCNKGVNAEQKSQVDQHLASASHKERTAHNQQHPTGNQPFIGQVNKQAAFNKDLCEMLISCDIPIDKVSNNNFTKFFNKYTTFKVPSQTTLRQKVIEELYEETLDEIRKKTAGKFLWASVDETTDSSGRYIANFLIGVLSTDPVQAKEVYLLNTEVLERTNHSTIAKFVDDSLCILGRDFKKDNLLLMVTDAAPYMVKAGKVLKTFYVNMLHLTCIAHGLHRVCEYIRNAFADVDQLIAMCKKVFLKSPSRLSLFREFLPDAPLPPRPVITRWGTWLDAASYYCTYFDEIKVILDRLDETESAAIPKAKALFEKPEVKQQLACLFADYGFLPQAITKFEDTHLAIVHQCNFLDQIYLAFEMIGTGIGDGAKNKLASVLAKNPGYSMLRKITSVLEGDDTEANEIPLSPAQIAVFKYAPLSSVDVERSFSTYKAFYRDNRHGFTFENIKKHMIIQCNKKH